MEEELTNIEKDITPFFHKDLKKHKQNLFQCFLYGFTHVCASETDFICIPTLLST